MSIFGRKVPPPERYDDVLYKFTYQGRDYISHCPKMWFPVPWPDDNPPLIDARHPEWGYVCYAAYAAQLVGVFIDGEYFAKAKG